MFKDVIRNTPMNTEAANDYFDGKIDGDSFSGDHSFVSTLRGLLANRIGDRHLNFAVRVGTVNMLTEDRILAGAETSIDPTASDTIWLRSIPNNEEEGKNAIKVIADNFQKRNEDWVKIDKVTALFAKAFDVACFCNTELRSVILFTPSLTIKKYHLLQCSILGILPWYFNPKDAVSEVEMSLIKSFTAKTMGADGKVSNSGSVEQYMDALSKIAAGIDFEEMRLEKLLKGIEAKYEEKEIENVKSSISDANNRIRSYENSIYDLLEMINESNIRLLGLIASKESKKEDSEILEYFKCNKNIYLNSVYGTKITFSIRGNVEFFDEEAVKIILRNNGCSAYELKPRGVSNETVREMMLRIFVDQDIKLRFCASYCIDLNRGVAPVQNQDFSSPMFNGYMPNPHIQHYGCLGTYERTFIELMKKGAYLEAIEQCSASAKSLNWNDNYVMSRFFSWLYEEEYRCLEMPDGSICSFNEAVAWVEKDKENAKKETEE